MVTLVLKNQAGQVARSFLVKPNEELDLVHLTDSNRLDLVADAKALREENIDFELLDTVTPSKIQKHPLRVGLYLTLAALEEGDAINTLVELPADKQETAFAGAMRKSVAGHIIAIILLLLGSWFVGKFFDKKVETEVIVLDESMKQKLLAPTPAPQPVVPPPKVKMAAHREQIRTVIPKEITRSPIKVKPVKTRVAQQSTGVKVAKYTEIGTLNTLDKLGGIGNSTVGTNKGTGYGKSDSGVFGTKSGMGGGLGAGVGGGIKNALGGRGLVAGLSGAGSQSFGAHGYGDGTSGGGRGGRGGGAVGSRLGDGLSQILVPAFEDSEIVGGLTREQVEAVVNRNSGQLRFCYERALQASPELRGRISSKWIVGASGQVTSIKLVSSSMPSNEVQSCVLKSIRSWQFPRPVGGVSVDVTFPFNFGRNNWVAKEG